MSAFYYSYSSTASDKNTYPYWTYVWVKKYDITCYNFFYNKYLYNEYNNQYILLYDWIVAIPKHYKKNVFAGYLGIPVWKTVDKLNNIINNIYL